MTEVTGRWNLTQVAKERVSGESAMMIEVWVPVGGGHPKKFQQACGVEWVSDRKEEIWMSPKGHNFEHYAPF